MQLLSKAGYGQPDTLFPKPRQFGLLGNSHPTGTAASTTEGYPSAVFTLRLLLPSISPMTSVRVIFYEG